MSIGKEIVRKKKRTENLFHVLDHLENITEMGITHESEHYGRFTVNKN